jgi:hypothetical protein
MELGDPMADGEVKECLTSGDVFERDFVELSDSRHDRFPRHFPDRRQFQYHCASNRLSGQSGRFYYRGHSALLSGFDWLPRRILSDVK